MQNTLVCPSNKSLGFYIGYSRLLTQKETDCDGSVDLMLRFPEAFKVN